MNCKKCKRGLYYGQKVCGCGEKVSVYVVPKFQPGKEYPPNAGSKAFGEKLSEVNNYIDQYWVKHPNATKREARLAYMQINGINLPGYLSALKEENDERLAIQQE